MVRERELENFREEVERDRRELLVKHQQEKLNLNIVQADLNSKLEKIRSQQIENSIQVQEKYVTLESEEINDDKILEIEEAERKPDPEAPIDEDSVDINGPEENL